MWTEETFKLVRDGIDIAKKCRVLQVNSEYQKIVTERANSFGSHFIHSPLNIVIFHAKVPDHATKINTPDIKGGDQSKIDYEALLKLNIKIARWSQPHANIFIFTDHESFLDLPSCDKVHVVRMNVNGEEPMFERVLTMVAYVNSKIVCCPT